MVQLESEVIQASPGEARQPTAWYVRVEDSVPIRSSERHLVNGHSGFSENRR